jgi:hypothetical protein
MARRGGSKTNGKEVGICPFIISPELADIDWTKTACHQHDEAMALPTMPLRTASSLIFLYALGYPVAALAVSAISPMALLVFRFGLAGMLLSGWALMRV